MKYTLAEEMTMRLALKGYIKYLSSFHCEHYDDRKTSLRLTAECYSLVLGIEPHTNERLIEARYQARQLSYAEWCLSRPYRDKWGRPIVQDVSENAVEKYPFDREKCSKGLDGEPWS